MAASVSCASSSTQRTHRRSSVGRGTTESRCGTCQTANASRLSPDIGEPPLRNVACLPRWPQVAFLVCETLRFSPGHRGRGVEKLTKNMTFEKMAAIGSVASSFHPKATPSCQDPKTGPSRYGTWHRARARRRWQATGTFVSFPRILVLYASLLPSTPSARSPGERRREVN